MDRISEELIDKIFRKESIINSVFSNTPVLLCAINSEGYFVELNNSWSEILGYTKEELKAIPFSLLIHPNDHALSMECWDFFQETGLPAVSDFTNRYRAKDCSYKLIRWFTQIWDDLQIWLYSGIEERERRKNIYINGFCPKEGGDHE